jgi:hypothetical protein
MKVYACSNTSCRAVFDADTALCAFCKANGLTWTLITCEVNHVTQVQACRPGDRALLSTPAGAELVKAAQKAMSDAAFATQQVLGDPREAVTFGPASALGEISDDR